MTVLDVKTIAISPEAADALREAQQLLQSALTNLPPLRPPQAVDQIESGPPVSKDGDTVSSVKQRERTGEGVAPHEIRAGADIEEGGQLPLPIEDTTFGDFFLPGGGFGGAGHISTIGGGGTYLDRRLLSYYLAGMAENQHFLDSIDFARGEEHWDGRYNFDAENRSETVLREAEADREHYRQVQMADSAARMQAEVRHTNDLYTQQRVLDDYHSRYSR